MGEGGDARQLPAGDKAVRATAALSLFAALLAMTPGQSSAPREWQTALAAPLVEMTARDRRPQTPALEIPNPPLAAFSCYRLPSHGASTFVIGTGAGWTEFLGCGHAFDSQSIGKAIVLDGLWPDGWTQPPQTTRVELVALDKRRDLSIVRWAYGPAPFVSPVAPAGFTPAATLLSVGFDSMKERSTKVWVTMTGNDGWITNTREKPVPGRSGGLLLDTRSGYCVGVCQGYDSQGRYVGLASIRAFMLNAPAVVRGPKYGPAQPGFADPGFQMAPRIPTQPQWGPVPPCPS